MSLIKFITVYDDEKQMLFSDHILERYNISAYPAIYKFENRPYFDGINTDSEIYLNMRNKGNIVGPNVPAAIFQEAYKNAYDCGYFAVVVVCPHGKWFPYYKEAVLAANRFKRRKKIDLDTFRISVIDSKSFAAGVMIHAISISYQHTVNHCPTGITIDYGRKNVLKNKTYILSKSANLLDSCDDKLNAYKSFGYKFEKIDISQSHDFIKYDMFAKAVAKELRKKNCKYVISVGADCDFSGNIIGRIEELSKISPICCMQYGIPTAAVLGNGAICINIVT